MMWENGFDITIKQKKQNVDVYLQFLWLHYEGWLVCLFSSPLSQRNQPASTEHL